MGPGFTNGFAGKNCVIQADEHAQRNTLLFVFPTSFSLGSLLRRRGFPQSRLRLFVTPGMCLSIRADPHAKWAILYHDATR